GRVRLPALLLTVGLAAGCSAQAEPPSLPVPTAASPSASPSPSAVALPSPKETGVAGEIERAVLAYYEVRNATSSSRSTAAYREVYTASCTTCETYADRLDTYFAKDQTFRGAVTEVLSLRVLPGGTPGTGSADLRLRVPAYALVGADGAVVEEFEGSEGSVTLFLGRQPDGAWKVASVVNGSKG
ncbi:MAG: hypothetical protein JWO60_2390, partial [Frankiales bacterium]|nr:hypothetical protein [Frankiales bacterium]